jgi:hypothetical protein
MRSLLLAAMLLAGCSKTETRYIDVPVDDPSVDGGNANPGSPDSGLGVLTFRPATTYSGFDGTHSFKVPLAVYDADSDLVVTANSGALVEPKQLVTAVRDGITDNGRYYFVTIARAGNVTLTATSKGRTTTATINVTTYASTRWAIGQTRYLNGSGSDPPCADCHVNGAAIDHSPAALATATDEKIEIVITTGISTANTPIDTGRPGGHKWTVTESELDGLVTYLRALEPRGFK